MPGFRRLETDLRPAAAEPSRRSRWQTLWPIGGILLAAAVMLRRQLWDLGSVPDLGDPLFSIWRLAWVAHQVVTDPLHLFDANIFFPATLALTYSDSIVLPGLAAAPFLWAGVSPVHVYNLMFVSTFVLSGVAMFFLCRELTGHSLGAFVGALVFAFYPFRFEHYSHLELQMTFWFPLALLALKRALVAGRLRSGVLLGLVLAGQAWSCMYFGLMLPLYRGPGGVRAVCRLEMPLGPPEDAGGCRPRVRRRGRPNCVPVPAEPRRSAGTGTWRRRCTTAPSPETTSRRTSAAWSTDGAFRARTPSPSDNSFPVLEP